MKKIFLSLVFLFGVGTFVMADDTMKVKNDTVAVEDGFKNIDLKEVPQSVKDAIAKKYPESTLKSASLSLKEEGVKAYRIIYVTKEGVENSILINIKTAPAKTPAYQEVHLGRFGRYLSGYQRFYFRFPAGTERNHERLAGHLSGKLRSAVGTEVGKHSACPSRCEV